MNGRVAKALRKQSKDRKQYKFLKYIYSKVMKFDYRQKDLPF